MISDWALVIVISTKSSASAMYSTMWSESSRRNAYMIIKNRKCAAQSVQ